MKKVWCGAIFMFLIIFSLYFVSAAVVINEVMYDFPGSDENHEWVEIYNSGSGSVNLTGWKFYEDETEHGLTLINGSFILNSSSFAVIAQNSGIFLSDNPSFSGTLFDSSFTLLNSAGEEIGLWNGSEVVESITYDTSIGANGDNKTLQRMENGSWCENIPTPGMLNNCSITSPEPLITNESVITATVPSSVYNNGTSFSVQVTFTNFSYDVYEVKIAVKNSGGSESGMASIYSGSDWVSAFNWINDALNISERIFNYTFTLKSTASYTGTATLQIKARINESSGEFKSGNYTFTILQGTQEEEEEQNQSEEQETASSLSITSSPASAKFGESISVSIYAYRGDTGKYAVYLYAKDLDSNEKVSDEVTIHVDSKFTDFSGTKNLELKANCNNKLEYKNYTIVLEGLDKNTTKKININDTNKDNCVVENNYTTSYPETIEEGENFLVKVTIWNNENKTNKFSVWSYVAKDGKCYSCKDGNITKENMQNITIDAHSFGEIAVQNVIENAVEGKYTLRIIVAQDGGTEKEYTHSVYVENTEGNETVNTALTGKVVYEGKGSKATKIALWIAGGLAIVVISLFVARKFLRRKNY